MCPVTMAGEVEMRHGLSISIGRVAVLLAAASCIAVGGNDGNWPSFRGAGARGIAEGLRERGEALPQPQSLAAEDPDGGNEEPDLMTEAPGEVDRRQLDEVGLRILTPKQETK